MFGLQWRDCKVRVKGLLVFSSMKRWYSCSQREHENLTFFVLHKLHILHNTCAFQLCGLQFNCRILAGYPTSQSPSIILLGGVRFLMFDIHKNYFQDIGRGVRFKLRLCSCKSYNTKVFNKHSLLYLESYVDIIFHLYDKKFIIS